MNGIIARMDNQNITLETQVRILGECGIPMPHGMSVDSLLMRCCRADFETNAFDQLLVIYGTDDDRFKPEYVWDCDCECITNPGDYARVVRCMASLARGDLLISQLEDDVNIDEGVAWVSFMYKGDRLRWDLEIENDWLDWALLSKLSGLLERTSPKRQYLFRALGQNSLIAYFSEDEKFRLEAATGLEWEWLV